MNRKEKQLENEIEQIFIRNHRVPLIPGKVRLRAIMERSLHEIALRDALILAGRQAQVMLIMLMLFAKLLLNSASSTVRTTVTNERDQTPD